MPITSNFAWQLAEAIGLNWGKSTKWDEDWFRNFSGLIFATFQHFDEQLLSRAVYQFIQDSDSRKAPPFGELKKYLTKKLGADQVRSAMEASSCDKCSDGTRRVYCVFRIDGDDNNERRHEWVTRCNCERGALNAVADNFQTFIQRFFEPNAYLILGYHPSDPHSIELIEWHLSSWNPTYERQQYPAGVITNRYQGMTREQIGESRAEMFRVISESNVDSKRKRFRTAISRGKY
jgi:hypothetical protein